MSYRAQVGIPFSFPHPVRDVNGNMVAGQASAVTRALLRPDRSSASEVPVLSDLPVAGWVQVTLTLLQAGIYSLQLTNPAFPLADGRATDYDIQVAPGIAGSTFLLTSLDRVRERLRLTKDAATGAIYGPGDVSPWDSLLNSLISEVSDEYQIRMSRIIAQGTYTEYYDGTGQSRLVLRQGPLVSITSLESVVYSDNGAGGVTETRTLMAPHLYRAAGLRDGRNRSLGRIDLTGCQAFTPGIQNYRVVYVAGWDAIPEALVGMATTRVVNDYMTRETKYLAAQTIGDTSLTPLSPKQIADAEDRALWPFVAEAA